MWNERDLELRNLCDLGRWLLSDPEAAAQLDPLWRNLAFAACNSPTEWREFVAEYHDDPRTVRLVGAYQTIDAHNQQLPRSRPRQPVVIPQFDW